MRWPAIKKIWYLCKLAFPEKTVWPDVPYRFQRIGGVKVFDLESGDEVGEVSYETYPNKIVFKVKELFEEIPFEKKDVLSFTVGKQCLSQVSGMSSIFSVGRSLSKHYEGDELLEKARLVYDSEAHSLPFERWLAVAQFPDEILKLAESKKYKGYQRVRVVNPTSSEYNEMGVILDIQGDKRKGLST